MVVAISTGVVKANDPKSLREFGGSFELTEGWARKVLKGKGWEKSSFTFQRAISKFVSDHDISLELVLNPDQTPLSYVSPGKYTFDLKGLKKIPVLSTINNR